MIDPLRIAIALIPLGLYFFVIGMIRLKKSPTVISRPLDVLLLGMACGGLVAIGPLELFFPRAAFSVVGNWVWLVLLSLYALFVLLIAFHIPAGIVIYGATKEAVRSIIETGYAERGIKIEWLGDSFRSATPNIHAQIEDAGWSSVTHIKSIGKDQNIAEWIDLDRSLHNRLASEKPTGRGTGLTWCCIGLAVVVVAFGFLASDLTRVNDTLAQLFNAR
ncbi:MAG: hypothetical protein MUC43_06190 [Pirellula sp.]|jgi:hypothetical protein|nr:hypothetical protein [Pirellula sp.]